MPATEGCFTVLWLIVGACVIVPIGSCAMCVCLGTIAPSSTSSEARAKPTARPAPPKPTSPPRPLTERERKAAADAALRGEKPTISGWDGSCSACERYVKRLMNDPSSYEHVSSSQPTIEGTYWVVTMSYRGKNILGALVRNTRKFYIRRGEVAHVEEAPG